MHRRWLFLILAACSHKAEAPPPSTSGSGSGSAAPVPVHADAAAPPIATCLVRDNVDSVAITPATVDFCSGEGAPRSCWHVDIATKHVEGKPVAAKPADTDGPPHGVTRTDDTLTICTATSKCSTVKPQFALGESDTFATNADATVLARIGDGKRIDLYTIATWKKLATIPAWNTPMGANLSDATFAGPNVIAWINASPVSDQGRIFTLAGKQVGQIGDKDFSQNVGDSWATQDTTWLFKQLDRPRLIAVDVATAKLVKTYDLTPMAENTTDDLVSAAGVASSADTIVYLSGSGVVGVIARAAGTVTVIAPPGC